MAGNVKLSVTLACGHKQNAVARVSDDRRSAEFEAGLRKCQECGATGEIIAIGPRDAA